MNDYRNYESAGLDTITRTVRSAFHPLRQLRMEQSLSLSCLAKKSGVYRWTIHFIEIMRVKPKPQTMYKLGVALGVNPAELYVSVLEYGMETIKSEHSRTLRIVAQPGETPKQMIARLVHRQLHPYFRNLNKQDKSAAEFLKEVDVSKATIKNWLDGKCIPNTRTLTKLCSAFNITMDDLLKEIEMWNKADLSDPVRFIEKNIHRLEE
jgi:DNA-binding XRE family transcriptional regulator